MAKLHVESTASITVPTVQYGSILISCKTVVESDDHHDSLEELHRTAREATDKELQDHKAAFDEVDVSFFKMNKDFGRK